MKSGLLSHNIIRPLLIFPLLILVLMFTSVSNAEDKAASTPSENTPITMKIKDALVSDGDSKDKKKIALFNTIQLPVDGLDEWVKIKGNDATQFELHIDGIHIRDTHARLIDDNTKLQFHLKPTGSNTKDWAALFSRKQSGDYHYIRNMTFTVYQKDAPVQGSAKADVTVIDETWFTFFVIIFLIAIALFWWLAVETDIIRDVGPQPIGTDNANKALRKPYSLARTQMSLWFFVILFSYVFIWMVTNDLSTLTAEVLGLIGISALTGLSSAMIDSSKKEEQKNSKLALEQKKNSDEVEKAKLNSAVIELTAATKTTTPPANQAQLQSELIAKQAEESAKTEEIKQTDTKIDAAKTAATPLATEGFIHDILSDTNGVSFHRFQMLAWTLVVIIIFVMEVTRSLTMPEIDPTLLGLMAISSGTYIGFKLPQQPG